MVTPGINRRITCFTPAHLQRLSTLQAPVYELIRQAPQDEERLISAYLTGTQAGSFIQWVQDTALVEQRAREIARIERETVPVWVEDPVNFIHGLDDYDEQFKAAA